MRQKPIILNGFGKLAQLPSNERLEGVVYCENVTAENDLKVFADTGLNICKNNQLYIKTVIILKVVTSVLDCKINSDEYFFIAKNNTLEVVNGVR